MLKENRVIVAEGGPTLPTRMYEVELFKTIESYVKRWVEGIKREIALWVGTGRAMHAWEKSTAERNCDSGYTDGEIKAIPARRLLRKAKQRKMK